LKARREKQKDKDSKIDWTNYTKRMTDNDEFPEISSPGVEKTIYERAA
jgi:hypothetical protein